MSYERERLKYTHLGHMIIDLTTAGNQSDYY